MTYQEFHPGQALRDYVECIWILQSGHSVINGYSLPDGKPLLLFNLGHPYRRTPVRHPESVQWIDRFHLAHQGMETVRIDHRGPINLIGVRFHPYGFSPLAGISMASLTGKVTPVRLLFGKQADRWEKLIAGESQIPDKIRGIEEVLGRMIHPGRRVDPVVKASVLALEQCRGELRIGSLRNQLGISKSGLEKKYQTAVGLSAKNMGNIIRFNCIIRDWKAGKSLTELAYAHGFFDQAHFNRNFQAFTGMPPRRFFDAIGQQARGPELQARG